MQVLILQRVGRNFSPLFLIALGSQVIISWKCRILSWFSRPRSRAHPGGSLMLVSFAMAPGQALYFSLISRQGLDLSSWSQIALPYFVDWLTLLSIPSALLEHSQVCCALHFRSMSCLGLILCPHSWHPVSSLVIKTCNDLKYMRFKCSFPSK